MCPGNTADQHRNISTREAKSTVSNRVLPDRRQGLADSGRTSQSNTHRGGDEVTLAIVFERILTAQWIVKTSDEVESAFHSYREARAFYDSLTSDPPGPHQ
jgi:hypothetical protein